MDNYWFELKPPSNSLLSIRRINSLPALNFEYDADDNIDKNEQ